MKILIISPKNRTTYNFRGDLIKEIINLGHEVIVTGPNRDNLDKVLELGVDFREIPMSKNGTSIFSDLKYMYKLKKLMQLEKPDMVFSYTVKPVVYGAMAAKKAKIKNVNSMITGGGYVFTAKTFKVKILSVLVKKLYKKGLSCSKNVIFQNRDDLKEFVDLGLVKSEKCFVVNGSGVNMDHFHVSDTPAKIKFLMISRLLKSKGVLEYINAARILKNKYPEIEFGLLGKYEYAMQDAVPEDIVDGYISDGTIIRYEETADVRPFYEDCSVYVLPSYREGTPRTVLEAMASGKPIITTDTNGCRETVEDGKSGFLVPVKNVDSLVSKMEYFICNHNEIKIMGQASYNLCKEKFDVNKVNESLLSILKIG